jgi:hypothetical protein
MSSKLEQRATEIDEASLDRCAHDDIPCRNCRIDAMVKFAREYAAKAARHAWQAGTGYGYADGQGMGVVETSEADAIAEALRAAEVDE